MQWWTSEDDLFHKAIKAKNLARVVSMVAESTRCLDPQHLDTAIEGGDYDIIEYLLTLYKPRYGFHPEDHRIVQIFVRLYPDVLEWKLGLIGPEVKLGHLLIASGDLDNLVSIVKLGFQGVDNYQQIAAAHPLFFRQQGCMRHIAALQGVGTEEEVLQMRYRCYFANSLTIQLLFWVDVPKPGIRRSRVWL